MRKNTKTFITQATAVHGNKYKYHKTQYETCGKAVIIFCKQHGVEFKQSPETHLKGAGCKKCRYEKVAKKQALTTQEFVKRAKNIHGSNYSYREATYVNQNTKLLITCPEHGNFKQRPSDHITGKQGCPICFGKPAKTTEDFIAEAKKIHGNKYNYTKVKYKNTGIVVQIMCKKHGKFLQLPCNHLSKSYGCPKCGTTVSKKELEIKKWIESLGTKTTKHKNDLFRGEIDIFLPEHNIGIEYNGLYWHNSRTKGKNYHLNKTIIAQKHGIYLLHFWDFEWKEKQKIVKSIIKNAIGIHQARIFARKTTIDKNVSVIEAKLFCEHNHLHGFRGGKHYVGLRYAKRLVALMVTASTGEMVRFVVQVNTSVVGGFSRLLKYSPVTYSFVDRRVFTGKSYTANGFKLERATKPNYFYVKGGNYLGSRQQFQKHKLKKKLKSFAPHKTEVQNMKQNGYDQVFDCGNFVMRRMPLSIEEQGQNQTTKIT